MTNLYTVKNFYFTSQTLLLRTSILLMLLCLDIFAYGQRDTITNTKEFEQYIQSSYDILSLIKNKKYKEVKKLLPDNIMNSGYLKGNEYFTKEMDWTNSLLKENGMPKQSEVIVYIKKLEVPSLNRIDKTLVVSYIIPFSDRHSRRSDKIEFEFNLKDNKYLFETINLTRKKVEPLAPPPE